MSKRVSREGSRVPDVELAELADGKVKKYGSGELFAGRKIILFALPGAFTPTCSTAHVPGYVAHLKEFRDAGVDDIVCLSVNDPFVMEAWQRSEKAEGVHFVADSFAEFTQQMGMSIDHRDAGLGTRSWRYSMLVNDGVIEKMFIEADVPGDPFEVSDADTMLKHLRPGQKSIGPVLMLARHGCPFCARAKEMLTNRGITFDAVYLGDELTMQGVKAASGLAKVPQVFVDGKLVGGSEELEKFLATV
ncbi:MAG TPA: glutathione peroxidase [Steroidobacteraceae bacterium]|jgi:peroxiredoxin/glutaredoxin|nr:glutathione peroxidase [Steroidobacteraceae bacterium]